MKAVLLALLFLAVPLLSVVDLASAVPSLPHVAACSEAAPYPYRCGADVVCATVDATTRCVRDPCNPEVCDLAP